MTDQNTSHAVMAQRYEPKDSLDNFPTPPWATRALLEHVISPQELRMQSCWEPACGEGHMAKVLDEYFGTVYASDIHPYGYGSTRDFLDDGTYQDVDWIITNPPFKQAEEFVVKALSIARRGVAMLARTVFAESVGRYERLFSTTPPTKVAIFSERVPIFKERLDPKGSTATSYAWFVWEAPVGVATQKLWIPPCRKTLERASDYGPPQLLRYGADPASAVKRSPTS
jgi:hypothetical protein